LLGKFGNPCRSTQWKYELKEYRYPAHVNPRDTTSFMYMNLAISLLVDLGLDKETPDTIKADAAVTSTDLIDGDHFSAAARRTFLGCYYMSSAYVTRHVFKEGY